MLSRDWGAGEDIASIMSGDSFENVILTQTEGLALDMHKSHKNLNIIVLGGAGKGKTQSFVLPNLLQCNTSYVINDKNSYLLNETRETLEKNGYDIVVINVDELEKFTGRIYLGDAYKLNPEFFMEMERFEFREAGDRKMALFINNTHKTNQEFTAEMYSVIIGFLFTKAKAIESGKLNRHVRFILDDFHDLGKIPGIEKYIAGMSFHNISASIIVHNLSKLKYIYPKTWEELVHNCDSTLFMGCKERNTLEYMSERSRPVKAVQGVATTAGAPRITPNELDNMLNEKCVLYIRGMKPFYSDKYNTLQEGD